MALLFWLALLGGYGLYAWRQGSTTPSEVFHALLGYVAHGMVGPLAFVALFAVRPLVLFPASLLAVAAGFAFGPVWGVLLTVVGSNASATVAYLAGRFFGKGMLDPTTTGEAPGGVVGRYAGRMRENGFEAVLAVQSTYMPFDLVNYLAGLLRVRWGQFFLATAIGSMPGIVSFVLLGASFEMDPASGAMGLDARVLVASVVVFAASVVLSRYLKRRAHGTRGKETGPDGP